MLSIEEITDTLNLIKSINIEELAPYIRNEISELIKKARDVLAESSSVQAFISNHSTIISIFSFIFPILSPLLGPELGIPADITMLVVLSIVILIQEKDNITDFFKELYYLNHKIYSKLKLYYTEIEAFFL